MPKVEIDRRRFLTLTGSAAAFGGCLILGGDWRAITRSALAEDALTRLLRTAPRARYWTSTAIAGARCASCHELAIAAKGAHAHGKEIVKCLLCAQHCVLADRERGRCRARINVGGELKSLTYGRPVAVHVDPIEKKPFYHFLPGAQAYSLSAAGCPLSCKFCQNWELSQARPEDFDVTFTSPAELTRKAELSKAPVIAYTYNEPTVFAEYLLDVARIAKTRGIRSVMISCGYMTEAPLADMCDALDAIKIDLKGFSETFYRDVSGAALAPVLRTLKQIHRAGRHLEIVNLVVPTLNDAESSLRELSKWIVGELGPDVPVHFTRFHPAYQLQNLAPTPVKTLERARAIAMTAGIRYAYVGNVPGHEGNHTYCPKCTKPVIERNGMFVTENRLYEGKCPTCKTPIPGVWS